MIYGIILAGGNGKRMRTPIPKQYLKLKEKPIIIWTIDVFLTSNLFDVIYLAVNNSWKNHCIELLKKYYIFQEFTKIKICTSNCNNRTINLEYVIDTIIKENGMNKDDIVVSHDAVRPFVSYKILNDCILQTKKRQVAMAAVLSSETMYMSESEGLLTKSFNRNKCYIGQSPLGCKLNLLHYILHSYSTDELQNATAVSQLFINRNIEVKMSYGEDNNFKITTPKDLAFAEFYVKNFISVNSKQ